MGVDNVSIIPPSTKIVSPSITSTIANHAIFVLDHSQSPFYIYRSVSEIYLPVSYHTGRIASMSVLLRFTRSKFMTTALVPAGTQ